MPSNMLLGQTSRPARTWAQVVAGSVPCHNPPVAKTSLLCLKLDSLKTDNLAVQPPASPTEELTTIDYLGTAGPQRSLPVSTPKKNLKSVYEFESPSTPDSDISNIFDSFRTSVVNESTVADATIAVNHPVAVSEICTESVKSESKSAPSSTIILVDNLSMLSDFLNRISGKKFFAPEITVDLEGDNLGRTGTLSLIQIYVQPIDTVFVIDITVLGLEAFTNYSSQKPHISLRDFLGDPKIPKLFFDCRNDSDALFSIWGIELQGVIDVQLMELAARSNKTGDVLGLKACIQQHLDLDEDKKAKWLQAKARGKNLCYYGYQIMDERPLHPEILLYSAQDVTLQAGLYSYYLPQIREKGSWLKVLETETKHRIRQSHHPKYDPGARSSKVRPPRKWRNIDELASYSEYIWVDVSNFDCRT